MSDDPWDGMRACRAWISNEHLHHHARQVLDSEASLRAEITAAIANVTEIACLSRGREGSSLGADPEHFNLELRQGLTKAGHWGFEARIQDGIIFDSESRKGARVGGFDFCKYDRLHNLGKFQDYCFGNRAIRNGKDLWAKELSIRPHWSVAKSRLDELGTPPDKQGPTIVGEIQFGNWAMAFRDYLKVLDAAEQTELDLFVYLVPDGHLSALMSDGTVNFDKATKYLQEVRRAMKVPTWIVGVDVEVGDLRAPLSGDIIRSRKGRVTRQPREPV